MKQKAFCATCSTPHFSHYECSECHAELHQLDDRHNIMQGPWQYCPWCGVSLTADENTKEMVCETAWNLCKKFQLENRRHDKVLLENYVTVGIENVFGAVAENSYRSEWRVEVDLFISKYWWTV